ncbi:uncharacterized protein LOC122030079 isoform X1 [Zingiber officinale]|uniref:Uncharacterized protein n=1 Tax=Zingiber officinale TaxID=94328 RepID=A0A8J5CWN8_ZINOF|nr:uncharacterized protein LOC122030079 isoform X1 [Zingiber officinale]KAG6472886.1 hypothetical protein ZIOFF_070364 [Zingiber officinale]
MKRGEKLAVQSSPAAKARFRHQSLLQDYEDLVKETDAKRKNLHIAKQKKLKLHAEVKFLQKRYKTLSQNRSGTVQFRLKTKPKSRFFVAQPSNSNASHQLPAKDQSSKLRDDASPSTSAIIDLNQVSLPIGEDMDKYQFDAEPSKVEANDIKLSICRDVGHASSNQVGKRKITWQDQVALTV